MSTESLKRSSSNGNQNGTHDEHLAKKTKTNHEENGKDAHDESQIIPSRIHYVTIYASDLQKSKAYYEEVLGFKKVNYDGHTAFDNVWIEMLSSQADKLKGSATLSFHNIDEKDKAHHAGELQLSFFVKNLEQFHQKVSKRDDTVVVSKPTKQHWGGTSATYKGPDGVPYVLIESGSFNPDGPAQSQEKSESVKVTEKKEESTGNGVCHFDIPCEDSARAQAFYSKVFGWTFQHYGEYVMFNSNDTEYKLGGGFVVEKEKTKRITYPSNYLRVKDIDAALEQVKQAGGEVTMKKTVIGENYGFMAHFKDTEGNTMSLWQK